jgi:rod shape-determining protein MreC
MHDKAVRRRRAVLFALVACCLVLLTAYFGGSTSGGLKSVQSGAMDVLAPIQEGANKALKPVRDLFGWFGDTLDAKSQRDDLRKERDALRQQVATLQGQESENKQLRGLLNITQEDGLDAYDPVTARVYSRSPNSWYSTVEINKGSSDGLAANQPVVSGQGLVGKVKSVSRGNAIVMLLTDQEFGVAARAQPSDEPGTLTPAVGTAGDMLLELVPRAGAVREGSTVVTAGTVSSRLPSPFPAGILVGKVTRVEGLGDLDRTIHVTPAADLRRLDYVRVLTRPTADLRAAAGQLAKVP